MIRTAGSALREKEQEMLELPVENGVRTVVLTTHSECAAEKVAADPASRARFPHLSEVVSERSTRIAEFVARPAIARRVSSGALTIRHARIDTATAHVAGGGSALSLAQGRMNSTARKF